jgi:hypothetical protein
MCFEGDEPPVYGQNFGRDDRFLSISNAIVAAVNISRADGWFAPVLQPIEKRLCERRLRFLGWWWRWLLLIQPIEQTTH